MNAPIGPANGQPLSPFELASGLELLDAWSQGATQPQRNVVDRILFAVVERTVFADFDTVDDIENHMEFFVLTKCDVVVKIRINDFDSFEMVYVGSSCGASGLDYARPASISSGPDFRADDPQHDARSAQ
jgi:hypothetical protein